MAHTDITFDNAFTFLSVNFGTSHWNIPLPKTATLIRFHHLNARPATSNDFHAQINHSCFVAL